MTSARPARPAILYPFAQWYFFAAIVITWIGFSQSYFMRLTKVTIYHHIHGAAMGMWIALLILQPILYQRNKMALHRRLGRWGVYGLVPVMVVCGMIMIRSEIVHQENYPPGASYVLAFLDVYSLLLFLVCIVLGIYYGRNLQLHARYIAATVLVVLPPALGRALFFVPGMDTFAKTLNASYLLMIAALLVLLWDDHRKGGVRAPYLVVLALYVPMEILQNFAGTWRLWHRLMDSYARL